MIRILIVVPYEELDRQVREYLATVDSSECEIEVEHLVGTDEPVTRPRDVDIVVARGMTGKAIARANPSVHFVEIAITGSDLIAALWECRARLGFGSVGVVLTDAGICDPGQLEDLTGIRIHLRQVEDETDLKRAVAELSELGVSVFIGGLTLCHRCEDLGYEYVHIKSGRDAMERALNEAIASARSLSRERARTNLVAAVLDNAEDALFAVNRDGLVVAANSQASSIFLKNRELPLEGLTLETLLPERERESVRKARKDTEFLATIGDQLILFQAAPITTGTEQWGVLVTCRNVEALRETERKIRKALSKKGLVAKYRLADILCESESMRKLKADAFKYSQVDSNVFLVGETGTGKELFAQSIHNASARAGQPFVAVNCAALPEPLLESELFGYVEGAFSGAVKGGRIGLFELAHTGTIFLDEVGEMPLSLQAKILRVLEEREIRKIGGDTVVPVDVRIISATNMDIYERLRDGAFRQDLYYRINLLSIAIPPLRERPEDIEPLFRHFVRKYALSSGKPSPLVESDSGPELRSYGWPGNVRELRNFCERIVVLNESGSVGGEAVRRALDAIRGSARAKSGPTAGSMAGASAGNPSGRAPSPLADSFAASGLDHGAFAASLGISRTTLWRRLRAEAERAPS